VPAAIFKASFLLGSIGEFSRTLALDGCAAA
jgi:hypothetical protein